MPGNHRTRRWAAAAGLLVIAVVVGWLARGRLSADADPIDHASTTTRAPTTRPDRDPKLGVAGTPRAAITGTIRALDGTPIADAQVCAISNVFERRGVEDREPHCVRSDANGRYAIDGLLAISTEVHASAATYQPGTWRERAGSVTRTELRLRAGQTHADADITLAPGGVLIHGVVKDLAGGEIEGAQVRVHGPWSGAGRASALVVSGAEGRFDAWVAPGSIWVFAEAEGYASGFVSGVAPGQHIEIFLTPESILIGRAVLASTGEPVEGLEVGLGMRSSKTTLTDADGRFRLTQLEPGTYKPSARGESHYGEAVEQVHLGLGQTSEEVVIRVHPAQTVTGLVVVAGGDQPCTSGHVRLAAIGAEYNGQAVDDEGRVEFPGLPPGTYVVQVGCDGHVSEPEYPDVVVSSEPVSELIPPLIWEVREGLAIRGEVVDDAGVGLPDLNISARPLVEGDDARTQSTGARGPSNADGSFELGGLLPGRYEVSSFGDRPGKPEPVVVDLGSGADVDDVRLVMPAVGQVRGRVIDERGSPVADVIVRARSIAGQGGSDARTNDAGEFVMAAVLPGSCRVTAVDQGLRATLRKPGTGDDDEQGELVEVVANELVEVVLTVEANDGQITGVVHDEDGAPVADAFIDVTRMSDSAAANPNAARRRVRWSWDKEPVLTDPDGRFVLDGLPEGKFVVYANRKGGGEALAEDVALGSDVELVITSTGTLAGTVLLADGGTPDRFNLLIEDKASGVSVHDSFYRTDGAWRITELPAGEYEITATATIGTAKLEAAIPLADGEVREGLELIVSARVTLRGRIVDLETREPVAGIQTYFGTNQYVPTKADPERRNVSDSDGRFELVDVSPGRIRLGGFNRTGGSEAKYGGFDQERIIPAEPAIQDLGELDIVAKRVERDAPVGDLGFTTKYRDSNEAPEDWRFEVAVVRPGGPASATTLTADAVITKVDGHSVVGLDSGRYSALTRVPEGTTVKLELEGGEIVTIVAGPPHG